MLEFEPPILPFLMPAFEFEPLMLPLDIEPLLLFDIVVPPVLLPIPVFEVELLVVVVVELVVVFALPVLVLSVAQPVQNAATASKAKRAKVLRIEFSPVTLRGQFVKSCASASNTAASLRNNSANVYASRLTLSVWQQGQLRI
jgi:hypothetical protein